MRVVKDNILKKILDMLNNIDSMTDLIIYSDTNFCYSDGYPYEKQWLRSAIEKKSDTCSICNILYDMETTIGSTCLKCGTAVCKPCAIEKKNCPTCNTQFHNIVILK